jgi:hypothetical protein
MRKRDRNARFVGFWGPPALKRDLKRLQAVEDRPLSHVICAPLRLGIGRYFEPAGNTLEAARLKAKLKEFLAGDGGVFTSGERSERWKPSRVIERRAYAAEFDEAVESGNREYAANYGNGSRTQ